MVFVSFSGSLGYFFQARHLGQLDLVSFIRYYQERMKRSLDIMLKWTETSKIWEFLSIFPTL